LVQLLSVTNVILAGNGIANGLVVYVMRPTTMKLRVSEITSQIDFAIRATSQPQFFRALASGPRNGGLG